MSTVLIADDNPADVELLLIAFSENDLHATFHTAHDGRGALELLDRIHPDLILLDVKMPRLGGLEVLESVRHRGDLDAVPVIIMSSSKAEQDINRALSLGALRYWQKGTLFADVSALVQTLPQLVPALRATPEAPQAPPVNST